MNKKPFWQYPPLLRPSDFSLGWIYAHLIERCLETKETVTRYYNTGSLIDTVKIPDIIAKVKEYGGYVLKHHHGNRHANPDWTLAFEDGGIEIEWWPKNRGVAFTYYSVNEVDGPKLRDYLDSVVTRVKTRGRIYVVTDSKEGPQLTEMGVAGEEFIPTNYRPDSVAQYRHVVEDLKRTDPCGRIVLLDGPPGTGKTHMVRALLNEVPNATFILIPSNFLSGLGNPSFLTVLLREQKKNCPLVLVLEDADEALVHRKQGDTSAISALLNFSDGIFGALLDMRLICTTNIEMNDLDPAVVRDGRLCTRMEIGLLDTEMANAVFERITGKKGELKDKFYKLGTVYKLAKGNNSENAEKELPKKRLGFLPEKLLEKVAKNDDLVQKIVTERTEQFESVKDIESITDKLKAMREREESSHDKLKEVIDLLKDPDSSGGEIKRSVKDLVEKAKEEIEEVEVDDGPFSDAVGETIMASVNGELVQVGHIDTDGNLVITDESFDTPEKTLRIERTIKSHIGSKFEEDFEKFKSDGDPAEEDDVNEMPDYMDEDIDDD